jgi:hypothetical protein
MASNRLQKLKLAKETSSSNDYDSTCSIMKRIEVDCRVRAARALGTRRPAWSR